MSYADFTARQRRLMALRLMREDGDAACDHVLMLALRELGFPRLTSEQMRADIEALRERHLVTVSWLDDRHATMTLTERGVDVALGRVVVEGVAKPDRVG
ncbi:MAG: hypothetical protein ABTQ30_15075 [Rhizobiaceae bacterium]